MGGVRRVTLSAAVFVLICFFMPWVQVSCAGLKDSASGFDLARGGGRALWAIPLLMIAVIIFGLARAWKSRAFVFALVSMASGLTSAYLMNQKRVNVEDASGIIGARATGWLWLGLFSSLAVAASALVLYLKRPKSP